jgi:MYXO-CTERM domain-containing protein
MNAFFVSSVAALVAASAASAGFTGFTADRVVLSNGNIQYKVYANFDDVGLPSGQSWVFLNAYSHATVTGTMNAVHQDFFVEDGEVGTWQAGSSVSAADREFDSWVTASGLATSSGWGTALDPGFTNGGTVGDINNGAGWYDATPGTANTVTGGRMLLMQIVRTAANDTLYTANLSITYKVSGTSTPIQPGAFQYSIGPVPAPGAIALAGLAGLAGRRRR